MTASPLRDPVVIATGSYTERGRGTGVRLLRLEDADGSITATELASVPLPDPSFVLWAEDGTLCHAVCETEPTRLVSLRVGEDDASLHEAGSVTLRGSGGCHVGPGRLPGTLIVTDYASGTVEVVGLDEEGVAEQVIDVCDHGSYLPGRESHPHQSTLLPGTDLIAVSDLGLDRVYLYRQDARGRLDLAGEVTAPRWSGPRHVAADHESRILYLACELDGTIVDAVRGGAELREESPTFAVGRPVPASGRDGDNAPSHIEISERENHLLIANRGPDTLAVHSLGMMRPELVAEIEVGAHPRHFARAGSLVLVAAQEGDRIDVLDWDGTRLTTAAAPIPAPSVTCIAPRPRRRSDGPR